MRVRALIGGGVYGCTNKGDDAILYGMVTLLRRSCADISIGAMLPEQSSISTDLGIAQMPRARADAVRAMRWCDVFICGGGNIFQERGTLMRGFPSYQIFLLLIAKLLGKPVWVFASGVEGIRRPLHRLLLRALLNRVECLTVRDEGSMVNLRQLGVTREIGILPDPAYSLRPCGRAEARARLADLGIAHDEKVVAINVTDEDHDIHEQVRIAVSSAADYIISALGASVLFVPHDTRPRKDLKPIVDILRRMDQPNKAFVLDIASLEPTVIAGIIGEAHMLISMRMHPMIFAALGGVPMVSIIWRSNSTKLEAFCAQYDLTPLYSDLVAPERLKEEVGRIWSHHEALSSRVQCRRDVSSAKLKSWENRIPLVLDALLSGGRG